MRQALTLHPDFRCDAVRRIVVDLARPRPGVLALRYDLTGDVGGLVLPPPAAPDRTDELWRHTCFEAFARDPGGEAYTEVNLAPSTQWAAYRFDGYREGMRPADMPPPAIAVRQTDNGLQLSAELALADAPFRLGLTAVIEEAGGRISYWALAHPPGRPDFHHADCFALQLTATGDA